MTVKKHICDCCGSTMCRDEAETEFLIELSKNEKDNLTGNVRRSSQKRMELCSMCWSGMWMAVKAEEDRINAAIGRTTT